MSTDAMPLPTRPRPGQSVLHHKDVPPCHLLKLPVELRNAIYEPAVSHDDPIDLMSLPDLAYCKAVCANRCTYPPITRIAGQIGAEALSVFFAINRFVADVRWVPVGTYSGPPADPWASEDPPTSGIHGLQRAFDRIGRRHCRALRSLELIWCWGPHGEASLKSMAAWTALWASRTTCRPASGAIKHTWSSHSRRSTGATYHGQDLDYSPFDWDLVGDGTSRRPNKFPLCGHEHLRIQLRQDLEALAFRLRDGEIADPDINLIKMRIVTWVAERKDPDTEQLKCYIQKRWQVLNGRGEFRHSTAHRILDTQRSHLSPLLKLNPELRARIFAHAPNLHSDWPAAPSSTCALTAAWYMGFVPQTADHLERAPLHRGRHLFYATLPALLRLNHAISTEALLVYFRRSTFTVQLEFDDMALKSLRDFSSEVQSLKCAEPLELHIEWLWPQTLCTKALVAYAELFTSDINGASDNSLEPQLHLVSAPAKTTLTRVLVDLLNALENLGRMRGRRYGDPHDRLGGREAGAVFAENFVLEAWQCDCMLDWIVQDDERYQEAKEICRDIFRHDIAMKMKGWRNGQVYEELLMGGSPTPFVYGPGHSLRPEWQPGSALPPPPPPPLEPMPEPMPMEMPVPPWPPAAPQGDDPPTKIEAGPGDHIGAQVCSPGLIWDGTRFVDVSPRTIYARKPYICPMVDPESSRGCEAAFERSHHLEYHMERHAAGPEMKVLAVPEKVLRHPEWL